MSEGLIHHGPRVPVTPQTAEHHRAALADRLRRGPLPDAPTGPVVEVFAPYELAMVLEQAAHQGHPKVRLDMTAEDAAKLAQYLRRAVLAGV